MHNFIKLMLTATLILIAATAISIYITISSKEIDKKITANSSIMVEACNNMLEINNNIVSEINGGNLSPDEIIATIKKSNQAFLEYKNSHDNIITFDNYNERIFNLDTLHDTLDNDKCQSYL